MSDNVGANPGKSPGTATEKVRVIVVKAGTNEAKALILPNTWEEFLKLAAQKLKLKPGGVSKVETADGATVEELDEVLPGDRLVIYGQSVKKGPGNVADDETEMHLESKAFELMSLIDDHVFAGQDVTASDAGASGANIWASSQGTPKRGEQPPPNNNHPNAAGGAPHNTVNHPSTGSRRLHTATTELDADSIAFNVNQAQLSASAQGGAANANYPAAPADATSAGLQPAADGPRKLSGEGAARFSPLIRILRDHLVHTGFKEMERRLLAVSLQSTMPDWQQRLGVATIFDYIQEAAAAGLISVKLAPGTSPAIYYVSLWGDQHCGVVKWVKESYGFIQSPAHAEDLFYHVSEVRVNRTLQTGDIVDFLVVRNPITGKLNATQISLLNEGDHIYGNKLSTLTSLSAAVRRQGAGEMNALAPNANTDVDGHIDMDASLQYARSAALLQSGGGQSAAMEYDGPNGINGADTGSTGVVTAGSSGFDPSSLSNAFTQAPPGARHDDEAVGVGDSFNPDIPPGVTAPGGVNHEPWLYKTKMCKFWPHCPRGPKCWFAHGFGDLRKPSPIVPGAPASATENPGPVGPVPTAATGNPPQVAADSGSGLPMQAPTRGRNAIPQVVAGNQSASQGFGDLSKMFMNNGGGSQSNHLGFPSGVTGSGSQFSADTQSTWTTGDANDVLPVGLGGGLGNGGAAAFAVRSDGNFDASASGPMFSQSNFGGAGGGMSRLGFGSGDSGQQPRW